VAEVLKKLATAVPSHRCLFVGDLADAARILINPAIEELQCLGNGDAVALSSTSMAGAAMLRVLQVLSALTSGVGSINEKEKTEGALALVDKEQEEGVITLRELNGSLEILWHGLSVCIGKIEGWVGNGGPLSTLLTSTAAAGTVAGSAAPPPLPPVTQRVLPFVEAFFVLCEKLRSGPVPTGQQEHSSATAREIKEAEASYSADLSLSPYSLPPSQQKKAECEKGMTFTRFADKHRRLLNAFVRQNPAH
jgi:E3 ubiquitin-protein ligase HUWE1